jgi:type I restriction enzyme M protein
MLPEAARYATLRNLPSGASLGGALVAAMNAIMADFAPLLFVAPQRHFSERNGAVF